MSRSALLLLPSLLFTPALAATEEPDRVAIRKTMERAMGPLPGSDRKVPLDVKVVSEEKLDGYVRKKITFAVEKGDHVPAWLLDTAWNGLSFHVSQAFFPRTSAWDNLKKALKGELEDSVWDHLSGTISAPFTAADLREIAVKVIDDRGNELLVTRALDEAE